MLAHGFPLGPVLLCCQLLFLPLLLFGISAAAFLGRSPKAVKLQRGVEAGFSPVQRDLHLVVIPLQRALSECVDL